MSPIQCIVALSAGLFVAPLTAYSKPAPEAGQQPTIVKLAPSEQPDGQPRMLMLNRMQGANAPGDDTGTARNIDAGGPWIGVQFGPVPKPLRAHLKLSDNAGQMVLNVAEGSPADAAGIQQYDVITHIDGRDASVNMGEFLDLIRSFTPNETHQLGVIRGGSPIEQRVIVGSRPGNWDSLKYKYEVEEEPIAGTQLFQRGGMLEKDPQGNWQFKNLDQMKDMQDIWKYMPQFNADDLQFTWQRALPGQNQMQVYINKGNEIRIERGDDGKITVTKVDRENADESKTTATYDDEASFEKADPETFKSYKSGFGSGAVGGTRFFHGLNPGDPNHMMPFNFRFDVKELHEAAEAMRKEAEEAQKQADVLREQVRAGVIQRDATGSGQGVQAKTASTSFEVLADGSVRVVSRSGDSEVVRQFGSVDQMKNADPGLYEKYAKVLSADKE